MMAGAAEGGLQGINMNPTGDSMGGMQDAIMNFGRQKMEEERLRKLLATAGGGANTMQGQTGQSGMGILTSQAGAPMGYAPR